MLTVQSPLPTRARAALGKEVVDSYHAEEADKIMAPAKFLGRHGVEARRMYKVGPVGETIAGKVADTGKFDLLVMAPTATAHWPRWWSARSPRKCWPTARCPC